APARPPVARLGVTEADARPALIPRGKAPVAALVVVEGEADLLEVVHALGTPGRFPGRLDRREQKCDEDGDDGDDDQKLDEREAAGADTPLTCGRANHGGTLRGERFCEFKLGNEGRGNYRGGLRQTQWEFLEIKNFLLPISERNLSGAV